MLKRIIDNGILKVDSTFDIFPKIQDFGLTFNGDSTSNRNYQVCFIHTQDKSNHVHYLGAVFIMSGRSQGAYQQVFSSLKQSLLDINQQKQIKLDIISTDFEKQLRKVLKEMFKPTNLFRDNFHRVQALHRKAHKYQIFSVLGKAKALEFVKNYINLSYDKYDKSKIDKIQEEYKKTYKDKKIINVLDKYHEYYKKQWLQKWSEGELTYGKLYKEASTGYLEYFHRMAKQVLGSNPEFQDFFNFIDDIQHQQEIDQKYIQEFPHIVHQKIKKYKEYIPNYLRKYTDIGVSDNDDEENDEDNDKDDENEKNYDKDQDKQSKEDQNKRKVKKRNKKPTKKLEAVFKKPWKPDFPGFRQETIFFKN